VEHQTTPRFWAALDALPADVRTLAHKQYALLKVDFQHRSLQFKKVGNRHGAEVWSARVTLKYRALALRKDNRCYWFWIGKHDEYDSLL
jgi:hypothetical protein